MYMHSAVIILSLSIMGAPAKHHLMALVALEGITCSVMHYMYPKNWKFQL